MRDGRGELDRGRCSRRSSRLRQPPGSSPCVASGERVTAGLRGTGRARPAAGRSAQLRRRRALFTSPDDGPGSSDAASVSRGVDRRRRAPRSVALSIAPASPGSSVSAASSPYRFSSPMLALLRSVDAGSPLGERRNDRTRTRVSRHPRTRRPATPCPSVAVHRRPPAGDRRRCPKSSADAEVTGFIANAPIETSQPRETTLPRPSAAPRSGWRPGARHRSETERHPHGGFSRSDIARVICHPRTVRPPADGRVPGRRTSGNASWQRTRPERPKPAR